jgi:hypothetical protein
MLSKSVKASKYELAASSSSICSPHGFIWNDHSVLPEAVAIARSIGVLTRNSGDLADGDAVSNRAV